MVVLYFVWTAVLYLLAVASMILVVVAGATLLFSFEIIYEGTAIPWWQPLAAAVVLGLVVQVMVGLQKKWVM